MPLALEQVRRMRGGAQAHLMRCAGTTSGANSRTGTGSGAGQIISSGVRFGSENSDYYVVKFQNNPQGARILANELLATRLAARIGLPTPPVAVIEVREELIAYTDDLVMQLGRGRALPGRFAIRVTVPGLAGRDGRLRFSARRTVARGRKPGRFLRHAGVRQ